MRANGVLVSADVEEASERYFSLSQFTETNGAGYGSVTVEDPEAAVLIVKRSRRFLVVFVECKLNANRMQMDCNRGLSQAV